MRCPCGYGEAYDECCGRYHAGTAAPTAEALMRSRFTAFARSDEPYLLATWHPSTRPPSLDLDPDQRWLHLEVLGATGGSPLHTDATVEFRAHYRYRGVRDSLHENSRFVREDGRWLYVAPV
ncbi:YchJ family metal-binding protein [Actinosynnema sp. NPDC020468]|uniref:YchJ family protein n=1 Tax=Actinosynnema sp. NPDC020468 TaxID=3154488 RepID=UPI003410379F